MKSTEKLGLKKPDLTDYVNIGDLNDNMDILDEEVGSMGDDLVAHKAENETKAHLAKNISFADGSNVEEHQSLISSKGRLGHVTTGVVGSGVLTLQNGWAGNIACRKDDMWNTHLIGDNVRSGTTTRNTLVTTIPEGYRPASSFYNFKIAALRQDEIGGIFRVATNGEIIVESSSFTTSGVSFYVVFRNSI